MDYKLNRIPEVKCEDNLLPDIPELKFHDLGGDTVIFNATEYCKSLGQDDFDWRTFSRINKRYIDGLVKTIELDASTLFYQDSKGDILMSQGLTFIFLAFVDSDMLAYFNGAMADLMTVGLAFSDSFAYRLASSRLPNDSLREIINNRENGQE